MREEEIHGISSDGSSYLTQQTRTTQCFANWNGMAEIHDHEIQRSVGNGDEESGNQVRKVVQPFPVQVGSDLRENGSEKRECGVHAHDEGKVSGSK